MIFKNSVISGFGLIAAALFLTGCVADDGGHRPPVRPGPGVQQACPMIYAPVCGERGNARRTFGNSCQARAEGFRVVSNGECGRRPAGGWGGQPTGPARPPHHWNQPGRPGASACTRDFRPVCARRGSQQRTFANRCEAERAGFRMSHNGSCR